MKCCGGWNLPTREEQGPIHPRAISHGKAQGERGDAGWKGEEQAGFCQKLAGEVALVMLVCATPGGRCWCSLWQEGQPELSLCFHA